jgi:hypothetical protein
MRVRVDTRQRLLVKGFLRLTAAVNSITLHAAERLAEISCNGASRG